MSSSRASQCKPRPVTLIRTGARCSGEARTRRANHAKGAPIVRPSSRSTHKVSSSKRTALAEMLMPRPFDLFASRDNNPAEPCQIATGEAKTIRQRNLWPQPELRLRTGVLDMDVGRFARAAFAGTKEKPRAADAKHNRYCVKLARGGAPSTETRAAGRIPVPPLDHLTASGWQEKNLLHAL